jgi:general secretion pathway protein C
MVSRWLAFVIWAVVAASAVAWGLRLFVPALQAPLHTTMVDTAPAPRGDLSRLFGVDAAPVQIAEVAPPPDARFRLVGVAAPRAPAHVGVGYALIAVDGKPARAYRVGAIVDGTTVLQQVRTRGVTLGPRGGPPTVALEIAPLPPAATGTPPSIGVQGAPVPPGMMPGAQMPGRPVPLGSDPPLGDNPSSALPQS